MESNRGEALRCLLLAEVAFRKNRDLEKAKRLTEKSIRLFPSEKAQDFLSVIESQARDGSKRTSGDGSPSSFRRRPTGVKGMDGSDARGGCGVSDETSFTQEQVQSINRIRRCSDYYEILGLSKSATDGDLKRAYRKLALQFHPDKCRAPGASEAFKSIGSAFAVLSDREKRKQYDLYGPELAQQQHQPHNRYEHDPGHGFESDMTAEEIFNMFFGGGFPGQTVYMRRGDPTGRFRQSAHHQRNFNNEGREANNYAALIQLMPILIIVFMSLFSSFLVSDPLYSLQPSPKYNVRRTTTNLRISYYVKDSFTADFTGSLRRLENNVEEDYLQHLRQGCFREKSYKENLLWQARYSGNSALLNKAHSYSTPSCDQLEKIYNYG